MCMCQQLVSHLSIINLAFMAFSFLVCLPFLFFPLPSSPFLEYLGDWRKGSMELKFLFFLYIFSIDETRIKRKKAKEKNLLKINRSNRVYSYT